jgi:hypothetical protein
MDILIQSLAWPVAALIFGVYALGKFTSAIRELVERIEKIDNKVITFFKKGQDDVTKTVKELELGVGAALQGLRYGTTYFNNMKAFSQAVEWVEADLVSHGELDIKLTAVGAAFSWDAFMINIPRWLKSHPSSKITVGILLVNPDYLETLTLSKVPRDWAKESRDRVQDIKNLLESISDDPATSTRLCLELRYYDAVPQYHGLLLNKHQLFLGRTAWEFDSKSKKEPVLTVGTNNYRYFNSTTIHGSDRGAERIELFFNWHKYYWEYRSTSVIEFSGGRLENKISRSFEPDISPSTPGIVPVVPIGLTPTA